MASKSHAKASLWHACMACIQISISKNGQLFWIWSQGVWREWKDECLGVDDVHL